MDEPVESDLPVPQEDIVAPPAPLQEERPRECVLDEAVQTAMMKCAMQPIARQDELASLHNVIVQQITDYKEEQKKTMEAAIETSAELSYIAFGLSLFIGFLLLMSWIARIMTRGR